MSRSFSLSFRGKSGDKRTEVFWGPYGLKTPDSLFAFSPFRRPEILTPMSTSLECLYDCWNIFITKTSLAEEANVSYPCLPNAHNLGRMRHTPHTTPCRRVNLKKVFNFLLCGCAVADYRLWSVESEIPGEYMPALTPRCLIVVVWVAGDNGAPVLTRNGETLHEEGSSARRPSSFRQ